MAEIDRERELVALEGIEARPLVPVLHFDALRYAQELFRRRLLDDAGLLDEEDERRGTAVHDRQLRSVDVGIDVVHAEAAKRGHQVLDGVELRAILDEARGESRLADQIRASRD